jgi:hypothetical protein
MMDLSKIMAIAGRSGLYKMITQTKNGIVIESMTDGKRATAFAHERISTLEEISVFTSGEDLPLKDVFKKIYDKLNGAQTVDPKSEQTDLKAYFSEFVPEYDSDRVYPSDIRKILTWYNILVEQNILEFTEEEEKKEEPQQESQSIEENKTE